MTMYHGYSSNDFRGFKSVILVVLYIPTTDLKLVGFPVVICCFFLYKHILFINFLKET